MKRLTPLVLLLAAGAAAAAQPGSPRLAFGAEGRAGSASLGCEDGRATLSLWLRKPPKGVEEGEFTTMVRFFQSRRSIAIEARGLAVANAPPRLDVAIADAAAFLAGVTANGRLVAVSYAGRTIQPLPDADQRAGFLQACSPARP